MPAEPAGWTGVVLAAGRSVRMGRPKALLEAGGVTLVERAVACLQGAGCRHVVVAVPAAAPAVAARAGAVARVVVPPDEPGAPPLASLRHVLTTLPDDAAGAVVLPVDCPFVRAETVAALLARHARGGVDAVVPTWRGAPGHPVVIGRALFARIATERLEEGLRTLLADPATRVAHVAGEDAAVVADLDTPAEARRHGVRA